MKTETAVAATETNGVMPSSQPLNGAPPAQAALPLAASALEAVFMLQDRKRVLAFLEQHSSLQPLILEAHDEIRKYFPDSPLTLEVLADPEFPANPQLVLYIVTRLHADEALGVLDQLDETWWFGAMHRAGDQFSINLQYQRVSSGRSTCPSPMSWPDRSVQSPV